MLAVRRRRRGRPTSRSTRARPDHGRPGVGPLRRRRRARGRPRPTGFVGTVHDDAAGRRRAVVERALEVAVATRPRRRPPNAGRRSPRRASGPSRPRVGVPCGIMDQLASLAGVEGHALLHRLRLARGRRRCRSPTTPRSSWSTPASTATWRRRPTPNAGPSARRPSGSSARCADASPGRRRGHRRPRAAAPGPPRRHRERAGRRRRRSALAQGRPRRRRRAADGRATPACATTSRCRPRRSTTLVERLCATPGVLRRPRSPARGSAAASSRCASPRPRLHMPVVWRGRPRAARR